MKGGPAGVFGTAPLVFTAAKVVEKQQLGEIEMVGWEEKFEELLGYSVYRFLNEKMKEALGFINLDIKCPSCCSK